jgi:hypothetical protein
MPSFYKTRKNAYAYVQNISEAPYKPQFLAGFELGSNSSKSDAMTTSQQGIYVFKYFCNFELLHTLYPGGIRSHDPQH